MDIAKKIGTYETSILPYEDCCTVFTPKHPRTRPVLKFVKQAEDEAKLCEMIEEAVENVKLTIINP